MRDLMKTAQEFAAACTSGHSDVVYCTECVHAYATARMREDREKIAATFELEAHRGGPFAGVWFRIAAAIRALPGLRVGVL